MRTRKWWIVLGVLAFAAGVGANGGFTWNFGLFRDQKLEAFSEKLFGVRQGVEASSTESTGGVLAEADPTQLVTLAKGLHAHVLSAQPNLGANIDMMALWPNDANPTHIIACNEAGAADPGLQRIRLSTGAVETMITGLTGCDPVKRTAWG